MRIVTPIKIDDAALLATNVPEVLYPQYDPGYVYALGARVSIIGPDVHQVYESLQAGNQGHSPAASPDWWIYVSATNPWLMFDSSVTSRTLNPNSIEVSLQTQGRILTAALLNVEGSSALLRMTDPVEGVVYEQTHSLVSTSGIDNWYAYFFEPIVRRHDLVVSDMPGYESPILDIEIRGMDETVACGVVVVGPTTYVGETSYGATVEIRDYSRKDQDDFGNYAIVQRSFSKRATFPVVVAADRVDSLHELLASLRAEPALYVGTSLYASTVVYGFYKQYSIEIAYPTESALSIEVEGLT